MAILLTLCAVVAMRAQTAHFSGVQSTVGRALNGPLGVAVDASGTVYIADSSNNRVLRVPAFDPNCSVASNCTAVGNGSAHPSGVAVDAMGNVYIASAGSQVIEVPVGDLTCANASDCQALPYATNTPVALALDGSGGITIAQDVGGVETCSPGIGCAILRPYPYAVTSSHGVAFDSGGNLYVSNFSGDNALQLLTASGARTVIGSGLAAPAGIAVDPSGNVYIADSGHNRVLKLPAGDLTCSTAGDCVAVGAGLVSPYGLATDGQGNLYIADSGNNRVLKLQTGGGDFGALPVGTTSTVMQTVIFTLDSAGSLGSSPVSVLTASVPHGDFADVGTGTCATNGATHVYAAGDTCTVDVTFTPRLPGTRYGAVVLQDDSGNALASIGLQGTGTGPQINFLPGTVRTLGSGFDGPSSVAVDGSGNVFVADGYNSTVKQIVATGGSIPESPSVRTLASVPFPAGLAVDARGDLFVRAFGDEAVREIQAVDGAIPTSSTPRTIGFGLFSSIYNLAVDGKGNVFVADYGAGAVKEILAVNGDIPTSPTVITLTTGFTAPVGVAVDGMGNVYIADANTNEVAELVAVNGVIPASPTVRPLANGFFNLNGVAVDGVGNVFVSDFYADHVGELVAVNGTVPDFSTPRSLGSGFFQPGGLAVDGHGNVFVADTGNNAIKEIDLADPPTFTYPTPTFDGNTDTTDGPQTVQIANAGNDTLNAFAPSPTVSSNFIGTDPGTPNACGTGYGFSLAPGETCYLRIAFQPTRTAGTGAVPGTMVLNDNVGNATAANPATQTIQLSGTAMTDPHIQAQPASQTINPGQTATLTVTAEGSYGLSYIWFQGVSGDTSHPLGAYFSSVTTPALNVTTAYWVVVLDGPYYANSATAIVTVVQPLAITSAPASQTINAGQTATLSVVATGSAPLSYQWYQGLSQGTNAPVSGATSASFTTPVLNATTGYLVTVSNAAGSVNSATATITVNQPPVISSPPGNATINAGQAATLSVVASGTAPLGYQWFQGLSPNANAPVIGATAAAFATPVLNATASYWVQVSNAAGTVNSATATITVNQPPVITGPPASQTINAGKAATLSVVASGTDPLNYQWFQGLSPNTNAPVAGATTAVFATPGLSATTVYWVQVSNVAGTVNSGTATITVNQPAVITAPPLNQRINTGQSTILSVAASGTAPLTYQWYQGTSPNTNAPIAGATAAIFTTPILTATAGYWVQVINVAGTANSATVIVSVNQAPVCTLNVAGTSTALTVVATAACTDPQNQALTQTIAWGDGTTGTATSTNRHTYAAPGTFTVLLTAMDASGLSGTAQAQVTPNQLPVCTLGVVTGIALTYGVSTTVSCTDPQNQQLTTSVDWGDQTVVAATNNAAITHTYATSGTYSVTAIAVDSSGLTGVSAIQPVNVLPQAAPVPPGQSTTVTGMVPAQISAPSSTQVTFLCTSVSTILNGQPATNVLPSQFGISCTSPTVSLTSAQTPVNVTIQTTTATVIVAHSSADKGLTFYAMLFPVASLWLLALGNLYRRRPTAHVGLISMCALAVMCLGITSCTQGFTPPPAIATPTGQYYVTVVETVVKPPAPSGFIQSSLIVPLPVGVSSSATGN